MQCFKFDVIKDALKMHILTLLPMPFPIKQKGRQKLNSQEPP